MRIVLITPNQNRVEKYAPLGILYIAAVIEKMGHSVRILDMNDEAMGIAAVSRELSKEKPDIIGLSGMITDHKEILQIGRTARKASPKSKIILGGPLPSSLPDLLRHPFIDFVVIGEGEVPTKNLIEALEKKSGIEAVKGIGFKKGGKFVFTPHQLPILDLDAIPFPARHLIDMGVYLRKKRSLLGGGNILATNMLSSRGCPYQCIYCFKGVFGNRWRGRSAKNVVDEMELLHKKYNIEGIVFSDDTFVLDRKRVFDICGEIKRRKLKVSWFCNGRVNLVDYGMLKAMRDAGCIEMAYGIESGNQRILDLMGKGVKLSKVVKAVELTKKAGMKVAAYFMIGMYSETKGEILDTIDFARRLGLDFMGFSITVPHPTTKLFDLARDAGLLSEKFDWEDYHDYFGVNVNLSQVSDEDLLELYVLAGSAPFLPPQFSRNFMRLYYEYASVKYAGIQVYRNIKKGKTISRSIWVAMRTYVRSKGRHTLHMS